MSVEEVLTDGEAMQNLNHWFEYSKTPEFKEYQKKKREELQNFSDEVLSQALGKEIDTLKSDALISCLRDQPSLYKDYAESVKANPMLKTYFCKHTYKGKEYLVVPVIDKTTKKLHIQTHEIKSNSDGVLSFVGDGFGDYMQESVFNENGRYANLIPVNFPDETAKDKYGTLYMNRWTGKIEEVSNPYEYKLDDQSVRTMMSTIEDRGGVKISDCSEGLQSAVEGVLGNENELDEQGRSVDAQKHKIYESVMHGDISGAISGFIDIVKSYFTRKERGRVIDIGRRINYEGDERDVKYLESAIKTVLDPERRSELTYLLSKIKDKHTKELLKEQGVENPSQFDLFLQQCEPGQIMLTNALDLEGESGSFKFATQAVSGARWCHALIVSDVIKDNSGRITDAKIIQSTLKGGVHETTLKKYISENYSSADLMVANIPEENRETLINSARSKIGQKYDKVSIVTDAVLSMDVDSLIGGGGIAGNVAGKNKAYCSELVFDAMQSVGMRIPDPHMSPSDILLSDEVSPQYTCYCEKF